MNDDQTARQSYRPARISRESVISKAAREIRRLIQEENLKAGTPLPTEMKLSQGLGISRSSVREALRILDGLGVLEKYPGRRAIVKEPSKVIVLTSVDESALLEALPTVYRVRILLEERCAVLAAQKRTEGELAEMEGLLAQFSEALKREDAAAVAEAHAAFHVAVVTAARNPVIAGLFEQLRFAALERVARVPESVMEPRQFEVHATILDGIRARDARRAHAAMHRHFQIIAPLVEFLIRPRGERTAETGQP
jgi:DNA-binding FadR family transcriptional regulator